MYGAKQLCNAHAIALTTLHSVRPPIVIIFQCGLHCGVMKFVLTGAGIYVTDSELSYSSSSLPNNSIITSYTRYLSYYSSRHYRRMGFYCCSNSTSGYAGSFMGLNGNTYSGQISVERYSSSSSYTGCMNIYLDGSYRNQNYLSEQGIYTCRMPDSAGRNIDVSVGIYHDYYSSKFLLLYIQILLLLTF